MAMGTRKDREEQEELWVPHTALPKGASHPFYQRLNQLLEESHFDEFVEGRCQRFYAKKRGRPSLVPGVYFRLLLIGYFEGIDSERGMAWRANDSLALRRFLRVGLEESPPDHSTISRTRRLIDVETHREVFSWVLGVLAKKGLLKGQTLGIDATTLEANAALRTIVRRDTGEGYQEFLKRLAQESGIATPTREQLARLDRKRARKGSNEEWEHPHDPDARIAKMKDGRTHLAHKVEQAVDFSSGAVVAVTLQPADRGDTASVRETVCEAGEQIATVAGEETSEGVNPEGPKEVVLDKGYHSNEVLTKLAEWEVRSYCSEPERGRRRAVAAHLPLRQLRQHFVAVVSLVQHHFLRPFRIHSLARLLARDRGDLLARFTHRLPDARRIAPVGRLQRDRHHRSAAEVHRLLHLVRQVRAPIFHLGDARVGIVRVLPLLIRPLARTLPVQPRQLLPRRRRNP